MIFAFFFLPFWKLCCVKAQNYYFKPSPEFKTYFFSTNLLSLQLSSPCGTEPALQNLGCEERLKQRLLELIAFIVLTDSRAKWRQLWSEHKKVFQQVSPLINKTANMVPII